MENKLQRIEIESVKLKQVRAALYQLTIRTTDRAQSFVRSEEKECSERDFWEKLRYQVDFLGVTEIKTELLPAGEIIDAVKIIKAHLDDDNRKIDRINENADAELAYVRNAIASTLEHDVDIE